MGLSKRQLYELTSKRMIPYHKPSGKLNFFKVADLEEYMGRNRQKTRDEIEMEAVKNMHLNKGRNYGR